MKMQESNEAYFKIAAGVAQRALCQRDKCGAIIVKDGQVIGVGYNAPPNDDIRHVRCQESFVPNSKPKSDRTCCLHAEWRAILDALRTNAEQVPGSTLFFTRVDDEGTILFSGAPYCTVCSRLALDVGIGNFALWHPEGIRLYPTNEYDDLSNSFEKNSA